MFERIRVMGEDFIGLFGFATDRYALLSNNFPETDVLGVDIVRTKVYGTNLIGMFCVGNSSGILVPYFISDREMDAINKSFKGLDLKISKVADKYTALGNLIACNDTAAIVSPKLKSLDVIQETLEVPSKKLIVGSHEEVGAYIAATNKGFLTHPDAEKDIEKLSRNFKVPGLAATVNCGVHFVKSGIIANSNGYITGRRTTGIELGMIDEALGFI